MSKEAALQIDRLGLSKEEVLDAAVLPDVINDLSDNRKEFLKRFETNTLKMFVEVGDRCHIVISAAQWV